MPMTKDRIRDDSIAGRVKLPTRVVIHRSTMSPSRLGELRSRGEYGPIPADQRVCELEVGGQILARGRIVRRGRRRYFKVLETGGDR
jgi:hypothetical protein